MRPQRRHHFPARNGIKDIYFFVEDRRWATMTLTALLDHCALPQLKVFSHPIIYTGRWPPTVFIDSRIVRRFDKQLIL
jgi:hypothetical protein